jgi:hypothetical protein
MRIERLGKTPSGKIHGRAIFAPEEREQAVTIMERLDSIRDEQHHSRPKTHGRHGHHPRSIHGMAPRWSRSATSTSWHH